MQLPTHRLPPAGLLVLASDRSREPPPPTTNNHNLNHIIIAIFSLLQDKGGFLRLRFPLGERSALKRDWPQWPANVYNAPDVQIQPTPPPHNLTLNDDSLSQLFTITCPELLSLNAKAYQTASAG